MIIMRHLFLILALFTSLTIHCQDVLVTNDGESLKVYNMEIGPSAIFYQLSDADNAEIKRIAKTDVLIIRKADGTKIDPNAMQSSVTQSNSNATVNVEHAPPMRNTELEKQNESYITSYNGQLVRFKKQPKNKEANMLYCMLGVKNNSQLLNNDIKISIQTGDVYTGFNPKKEPAFGHQAVCCNNGMQVSIQNLTDKTIFLDKGNSFFMRNGEASPYYIPSAKSTTSASGHGTSVNLGAIASAAGIGGAMGTLASGVNVGGSSSEGTTNTVYSQRIVAVPPKSTYKLDFQEFFPPGSKIWDFKSDSYYNYNRTISYPKQKLKWGDIITFSETDSPISFGFYLTYSFQESCEQTQSLFGDLYLKEIQGVARDVNYSGILASMWYMTDNWHDALYIIVKN